MFNLPQIVKKKLPKREKHVNIEIVVIAKVDLKASASIFREYLKVQCEIFFECMN